MESVPERDSYSASKNKDALQAVAEELSAEFKNQIETPQGGDYNIAAMCLALSQEFADKSELAGLITQLLMERQKYHPDEPAWTKVNIIRIFIQKELMFRGSIDELHKLVEEGADFSRRYSLEPSAKYPWNSPLSYDEPDPANLYDQAKIWREKIQKVFAHPLAEDEASFDLVLRNVLTNKPQRYKATKIIVNGIMHERFAGQKLKMLDVGCSLNEALKSLKLGANFGAAELNVLINPQAIAEIEDKISLLELLMQDEQQREEPDPSKMAAYKQQHVDLLAQLHFLNEEAEEAEKMSREAVNGDIEMDEGVGVDIWSVHDAGNLLWSIAGNNYFTELLNDRQNGRNCVLDDLEKVRSEVDGVKAVISDLLKEEPAELEGQYFDVINIYTMLHQIPADKRPLMIKRLEKYLQPPDKEAGYGGGIIIITDFAYIDENNELAWVESFNERPYTYRTIIIDPFSDDPLPKEKILWISGRCNEGLVIYP
jgi:hypothetical protein